MANAQETLLTHKTPQIMVEPDLMDIGDSEPPDTDFLSLPEVKPVVNNANSKPNNNLVSINPASMSFALSLDDRVDSDPKSSEGTDLAAKVHRESHNLRVQPSFGIQGSNPSSNNAISVGDFQLDFLCLPEVNPMINCSSAQFEMEATPSINQIQAPSINIEAPGSFKFGVNST